jgi:MFS family permease
MRQVKPARFVSLSPIIGFSVVIFFVALSDAIMSYMAPIAIEEHLRDPALVGIVLSISSFFGIGLDFYIAQRLPHKSYRYFLSKVFIYAFLFPIILLIMPSKFIFFCIAMVVWSVYYEFIGYSKYNFIKKYVRLRDHTNAWGTLSTFGSLAYMIGPGIAAFLVFKFTNLPFYTALVLVAFSSFLYFLFERSISGRHQEHVLTLDEKRNILKELGVLRTLMKKLWVLVVFTFVITLMDVLMWTVGVLYSGEIGKASSLGNWLLVVYGLPALFTGIVTNKLRLEMGKKKMSFTSAAIAGLSLIFVGFNGNTYSILFFVFLMSAFFGISAILLNATFQDYIARAKVVGNDIASILQLVSNVSYAVGPIVLGFVAKYFGYARTFQLVGYLVFLVSLVCFFIIPRKIKMPQKELIKEIYEIEVEEEAITAQIPRIGKARK